MTGATALMFEAHEEPHTPTGRGTASQRHAGENLRPLEGPLVPSVRLLPTAEARPAPIAEPDPPALLKQALWRAIDRTGLRHLAYMLGRYPKMATGLFLPALTMSFLFFLMSDFVALILGVYSIAMGLVFAVAAAREMARDGIDFAPTSDKENAS